MRFIINTFLPTEKEAMLEIALGSFHNFGSLNGLKILIII